MSADTPPPAGGVSALQRLDTARHSVIKAALNLAATEWGNGSETAHDSADLDYAHDRLDSALDEYAKAHAVPITPAEPVYPAHGSAIPDQPGFVVGKCGHRVAKSEWRAGYRTCERCPVLSGGDHSSPREFLTAALVEMEDVDDAYLIGDDGNELGYLIGDQEYRVKVTPA